MLVAGALLAVLLGAPSPLPEPGRNVTTGPAHERPARGKLLIAAASLADPNFIHAVILLVSYDAEEGAMGVIVNQPLDIPLGKVLPEAAKRSDRLWRGGPVMPTSLLTLVRRPKDVADTEVLFEDVRMVTGRAGFERAVTSGLPPERLRAFAGHAGWAPGQLETELARGDWALMPATGDVVFAAAPERVWPKLMQRTEGKWTWRPTRRRALAG